MRGADTIAILILAAGQSSRMNDIKQLLPWKGSNLLLHTINTVLQVQNERVYLVLGANADFIVEKSKLASQPVTIIRNKAWENGLGSSISCGVAQILEQHGNLDGILICLADQPLLTSVYYKELLHVFKTERVPIAASGYPNKSGVPAVFNSEVAKELIALNEDFGAKHLMAKYKNKMVILDAGQQIMDIDTPQTYNALFKKHNS